MTDAALIIPGVIHVGSDASGKGVAGLVQMGPAVGWTMSRGVNTWSRELSVVVKEDLTPALRKELNVVLPEEQGDPDVVPRACRAAKACKLVAVEPPVVEQLLAKKLRVHTVGFDRVSTGFFYIAVGGSGPPKRVQGELIEMVAGGIDQPQELLDARLDGLIDRLVAELSDGILSEAELELAEALPSLGPPGADAPVKLQTLEGWLILAESRSNKFGAEAARLVQALRSATRRGAEVVEVPLFGQAQRVTQAELEVEFAEGEAGVRRRATLPARTRWLVAGRLTPSTPPQPSKPAREKLAAGTRPAPDAAEQRAARERVAAEKTSAERSAVEARAAAEARAEADRAAAEKAAAAARAAEARAAAQARAAAEARAATERQAASEVLAAAQARAVAEARAATEAQAAVEARAAADEAERKAAEQIAAAAAEKAEAERMAAARAAAVSAALAKARKKHAWRVTLGFVVLGILIGSAIGAALRLLLR